MCSVAQPDRYMCLMEDEPEFLLLHTPITAVPLRRDQESQGVEGIKLKDVVGEFPWQRRESSP